jgi:hypothetical protein
VEEEGWWAPRPAVSPVVTLTGVAEPARVAGALDTIERRGHGAPGQARRFADLTHRDRTTLRDHAHSFEIGSAQAEHRAGRIVEGIGRVLEQLDGVSDGLYQVSTPRVHPLPHLIPVEEGISRGCAN